MSRRLFVFENSLKETDSEVIKILRFDYAVNNFSNLNRSIKQFCTQISSHDDPNKDFQIFLNSGYYFVNDNNAIIFYDDHLDKKIKEKIESKFNMQGYGLPYFIKLESGINQYSLKNNQLQSIRPEDQDLVSFYFTPNSFLIFSDLGLFYKFTENLKNELSRVPNFDLLLDRIHRLEKENEVLMKEKNWLKQQVSNYNDYLKVIKKLIADKSSLAILTGNSPIIKLMKKNHLTRKYGKMLFNKFYKK